MNIGIKSFIMDETKNASKRRKSLPMDQLQTIRDCPGIKSSLQIGFCRYGATVETFSSVKAMVMAKVT